MMKQGQKETWEKTVASEVPKHLMEGEYSDKMFSLEPKSHPSPRFQKRKSKSVTPTQSGCFECYVGVVCQFCDVLSFSLVSALFYIYRMIAQRSLHTLQSSFDLNYANVICDFYSDSVSVSFV